MKQQAELALADLPVAPSPLRLVPPLRHTIAPIQGWRAAGMRGFEK